MTHNRLRLALGAGVAGFVLLGTAAVAQNGAGRDVNWTTYFSDLSGSRFLPLDQINASNFNDLVVAWRFKTDNLGNRPEYKLEGTPIEINGTLYATGGNRRDVFALDATTGELLWVHGEHEGARGAAAPRQLSGRGLSYWPGDAAHGPRVLYVTPGYSLIALDARTGQRVASFGQDGRVDLKAADTQGIKPDLTTGEIGWQSAPTVVGDKVLIGSAFREGFTPASYKNNKGVAFAFDAVTGRKIWQFNTIPQKGEAGNETWLNGSAAYTGNTGVWTEITADPEAGLVYLPVESPTSDFYGGKRPGNNLYSDSLVAVDINTGKPKWHYQFIHHDIWDQDMSSAPLLMDITVDGKKIKAVAEPTKMGVLYVFDRITGKPVWPIVEKPVPRGNVPGEWYSPTQPFPTLPKPYTRTDFTTDDLIDFTPELRQKALDFVKDYKLGKLFTPAVLSQPGPGNRATLTMGAGSGGTNWPGGSFNPENDTVYVYGCNSCIDAIALTPPPKSLSDIPYVNGQYDQNLSMVFAAGATSGADTVAAEAKKPPAPPPEPSGVRPLTIDGLPLVKPPYNLLSAINLRTGQIEWQVPVGDTPDYIRNNPALKGIDIPMTGQTSFSIGTLVTKSLVIVGDPQVTTTPDHPRGAMLRAFDQKTGKQVGALLMPAQQSGSPMTYMVNGKQYIIVAVSGGTYSGEYICYTLPSNS